MLDKYAFMQWKRKNGVDDEQTALLLTTLERTKMIMLTDLQREYLDKYFTFRMTMEEMAEYYHVNKSTISRTIGRAIARIGKVMYCMDSRFGPVVKQFPEGPREKRAKRAISNGRKPKRYHKGEEPPPKKPKDENEQMTLDE